MEIMIVILLVIGFVTLLLKYKKKYHLKDIPRFIEHLYKAGLEGGFLIITAEKSKQFVQVSKYITSDSVGLELAFPKAEWTRSYYDTLKCMLGKNNIKYFIINKSSESDLEFLKIDFGDDCGLAVKVVNDIFKDIFALHDTVKLNFELHNVSPWNEFIDSSTDKTLTIREGLQTLKKNKGNDEK